jgi:hypothetical protein
MYKIQELDKKDIMERMKITPSMYTNLVKEVKIREITEITTDVLERLLLPKLNSNPDKDTIKAAIDIWKWKYKVPITTKDEVFDLGELMNGSQSTAPS